MKRYRLYIGRYMITLENTKRLRRFFIVLLAVIVLVTLIFGGRGDYVYVSPTEQTINVETSAVLIRNERVFTSSGVRNVTMKKLEGDTVEPGDVIALSTEQADWEEYSAGVCWLEEELTDRLSASLEGAAAEFWEKLSSDLRTAELAYATACAENRVEELAALREAVVTAEQIAATWLLQNYSYADAETLELLELLNSGEDELYENSGELKTMYSGVFSLAIDGMESTEAVSDVISWFEYKRNPALYSDDEDLVESGAYKEIPDEPDWQESLDRLSGVTSIGGESGSAFTYKVIEGEDCIVLCTVDNTPAMKQVYTGSKSYSVSVGDGTYSAMLLGTVDCGEKLLLCFKTAMPASATSDKRVVDITLTYVAKGYSADAQCIRNGKSKNTVFINAGGFMHFGRYREIYCNAVYDGKYIFTVSGESGPIRVRIN